MLGRYEIERVVGSGGMGIVLKGFDTELTRPVAIKVLAQHLTHSGAARQRFARESRAAAAIVHEHVVAIHNVEMAQKVPFIVMPYVDGESLEARAQREGPLTAKEVLRIGIQAAAGLAAAHEQGVIHRDIKPANLLLESGVERTLLTDFGLARTVDDASLTHTGIVAGTPHYMSPEQANGEATDHRTDLFSLGSVLYLMVTGRPPFRAERAMGVLKRICNDPHRPVWQVNPDVPRPLWAVIDRLLQKKPKHRFASADDVKHALTLALAELQHRNVGAARLRRLLGDYSRGLKRAAAALAACGLLAVCGLIAVEIGTRNHSSAAPDGALEAASELDESGTVAMEPSVEVILQAVEGEASNYSARLDAIRRDLDRLEHRSREPRFVAADESWWTADLASLTQQLNQLEHVNKQDR